MPDRFTGEETSADILRIVLDEFSRHQLLADTAEIIYQDGLPFLKFQAQIKNDLGEFLCYYRLDKMMLALFSECSGIYDGADKNGLLGESDGISREKTIRYLAYYAMSMRLYCLMFLQSAMFDESFNEALLLTSCKLIESVGEAYRNTEGEITKEVNAGVLTLLNKTIDASSKTKRKHLMQLLNSFPLLHLPTGVGRPPGTMKSAKKKAADRKAFEADVERAIKKLIAATGRKPTKTAVARELNIGVLNSKGGNNTSLAAFKNKLKGLELDYDEIMKRAELNE